MPTEQRELLLQKLTTICEGMSVESVLDIFRQIEWEPGVGCLSILDDEYMTNRMARLRRRLTDPLTAQQASAIREAIEHLELITVARQGAPVATPFMQPYIDTVVQWLDVASDGWQTFEDRYQGQRLKECLAAIAAGEFPWSDYKNLQGEWRERARQVLIERGYFPWEWVDEYRKVWSKASDQQKLCSGISSPNYLYETAHLCPRCGRPPDKLAWVYFFRTYESSFIPFRSRRTKGWLTICDSCHLQVDYFDEPGYK